MRVLLGIILIFMGLALAAYVGVWICFVGGLVQIIEELKYPGAVDAYIIAVGVAKIIIAGAVGSICAIIGVVPGYVLLTSK